MIRLASFRKILSRKNLKISSTSFDYGFMAGVVFVGVVFVGVMFVGVMLV